MNLLPGAGAGDQRRGHQRLVLPRPGPDPFPPGPGQFAGQARPDAGTHTLPRNPPRDPHPNPHLGRHRVPPRRCPARPRRRLPRPGLPCRPPPPRFLRRPLPWVPRRNPPGGQGTTTTGPTPALPRPSPPCRSLPPRALPLAPRRVQRPVPPLNRVTATPRRPQAATTTRRAPPLRRLPRRETLMTPVHRTTRPARPWSRSPQEDRACRACRIPGPAGAPDVAAQPLVGFARVLLALVDNYPPGPASHRRGTG